MYLGQRISKDRDQLSVVRQQTTDNRQPITDNRSQRAVEFWMGGVTRPFLQRFLRGLINQIPTAYPVILAWPESFLFNRGLKPFVEGFPTSGNDGIDRNDKLFKNIFT